MTANDQGELNPEPLKPAPRGPTGGWHELHVERGSHVVRRVQQHLQPPRTQHLGARVHPHGH